MNITAFMNLMVILVPFLLITAVFSRLTILELNLPPASSAAPDPKRELQLEVIIRADAPGDRRAQQRSAQAAAAKTGKGYDFKALSQALQQVKEQFPSKTNATILSSRIRPTTRWCRRWTRCG